MKVFNRWNGKIRLTARVHNGEVTVEAMEKDGRLSLDEYMTALLMMMARMGQEAEMVVSVKDRAERARRMQEIRGEGPKKGGNALPATPGRKEGDRPNSTDKTPEEQGKEK